MGPEAAQFCTEHLPDYVQHLISDGDRDIRDALRLAFLKMDKEWEKEALRKRCEAGAVGVFVYYQCGFERQSDCLYVANVGDCRAILCSKGKAKVLTEDHNGKNQQERARVGEQNMPRNSDLLSNHIQVTRAIGDYVTTSNEGQYTHKKVDGLISEPHIEKHELSDDDEFMIIACDGLWDVVSNDIAMKQCRRSLRRDGNVQKAAHKLITLAKEVSNQRACNVVVKGDGDVAKATSDNISVMVIGFAKKDKTIVPGFPPIPRPSGSRLRRKLGRSTSTPSPQ